MSGAIAFTIAFRPFYTAQTLAVWQQVRGIERYSINFHVEPSTQLNAQIDLIGAFEDRRVSYTNHPTNVKVNDELLGVLRNPLFALRYAFSDPDVDHVILAEEDVEVGNDCIEYVEFALKASDIACMWSDKSGPPDEVETRLWFNPWGWAITRSAFEDLIEPTWDDDYSTHDDRGPGGWDCNIGLRVVHEFPLRVAFPLASRSRHIGKWLGVHQDPSKHGHTEMPESFVPFRPTQKWKWSVGR